LVKDPDVIPAPHPVRDKLQPESRVDGLFWTPVFTGVTPDALFHTLPEQGHYYQIGFRTVNDLMKHISYFMKYLDASFSSVISEFRTV
jgi:hypothetical protein